ncbi:hypothetical protein M9H77_06508 [Catharanthus roseus]|uniref:Uncharacterized protein n=1 Tax=Catharanthus roseus TaxID=4058 RepID=A0ACC0BSI1_CATRO|nr:hypothetical protein M9H77_06508 [Catharanthus roseus]
MGTKNEVREHLVIVGFIKGYTHWVAHREQKFYSSATPHPTSIEDGVVNEHGDMEEMLYDAFGIPSHDHKFDLPPCFQGMVLQSIDTKWRNWKSKCEVKLGHPPTHVDPFNKCDTNSNGNPSSSEVGIAMSCRHKCRSKNNIQDNLKSPAPH